MKRGGYKETGEGKEKGAEIRWQQKAVRGDGEMERWGMSGEIGLE